MTRPAGNLANKKVKNSGRNMKIVEAEGAKARGPFGAVEQVPLEAPRL